MLGVLAGDRQQLRDAIGGLGAVGDPAVDLLHVELDQVRMGAGVVAAHFLDEAAVARRAGIGDDDAVVRALLGAVASEANLDCNEMELLLVLSFSIRKHCSHSAAKTAIVYITA